MREITLLYRCRMGNSKIHLIVESLPVAELPITYTAQECLEDFCDSVDWQFLSCDVDPYLYGEVSYPFRLICPGYVGVHQVLLKAHRPFE